MKLNRTDGTSLVAIGCGALVAVGLTGLVAERGHHDRHEVHIEHVEHVIEVTEERAAMKESVVEITRPHERVDAVMEPSESIDRATVRLGGGVRIIRSDDANAPAGPQPLLYVDGVRMEGDRETVLAGIDSDAIDRIEVVKGEAAVQLFGEEATGGVIQIFLKDIGAAHPGG